MSNIVTERYPSMRHTERRCSRYTVLTETGAIEAAFMRDANGNWQDITKRERALRRLAQQIHDAERELCKLEQEETL